MIKMLQDLRAKGQEEEGLTLIELIVVVIIIGILAAISIPMFFQQQKAAITAGVESDVRNTATSVATGVVTSPTATSITATATKGSSTAITFVPAVEGLVTTVSDSNTTIAVSGRWDDYTITGRNDQSSLGTSRAIVFSSDTGKLAEAAVTATP